MSDGITRSTLGDLPNAGYSSRRQKETTDAIMFFMRSLERNRPLLLSIVIDGPDKFVKVCRSAWRGLLVDRELLLKTYAYLERQAGANPAMQLLSLQQLQETAQRVSWDKRQRTADALKQAQQLTRGELAIEQHKPRKVYSH